MYMQLSNGTKGPIFGLSHQIPPYFVYASSQGSDKPVLIAQACQSLGRSHMQYTPKSIRPRRAVRKVSDCRYVSACRSRGLEFDPGPLPTFVEIDHEIMSTAILLLSADSRRVVVSY